MHTRGDGPNGGYIHWRPYTARRWKGRPTPMEGATAPIRALHLRKRNSCNPGDPEPDRPTAAEKHPQRRPLGLAAVAPPSRAGAGGGQALDGGQALCDTHTHTRTHALGDRTCNSWRIPSVVNLAAAKPLELSSPRPPVSERSPCPDFGRSRGGDSPGARHRSKRRAWTEQAPKRGKGRREEGDACEAWPNQHKRSMRLVLVLAEMRAGEGCGSQVCALQRSEWGRCGCRRHLLLQRCRMTRSQA